MLWGKSFTFKATLIMFLLLCVVVSGGFASTLSRSGLAEKIVTVAVDNASVVDVLKLLATQNELNLSVPGSIEGAITISLRDVSLVDALDVVTASAGASWYIGGNVIVVKPAGDLDPRELQTRLFRLQFISAAEAKKVAATLLPEHGKVEILSRGSDGGSGSWDEILEVMTDAETMRQVEELVSEIDSPRSLVEIDVRIIETSLRDETKLGLDFPDAISAKVGDLDEELGVEGFASIGLDHGKWSWGRMTAGEVTFLLDYLIQNGRSKLISSPRVTTLSNEEAEIEVATTIPVQTLNRFSEGGVVQDIVSFQDLDVSISLLVTPRVSEDSTITLDVASSVEEITGYTGPADNQRPITSRRSVKSSVAVKSGESLGLGGLMKDIEHKTVKKFPLLGSVPVLGRLFQHHTVSKEKSELLILITPRIIPSP